MHTEEKEPDGIAEGQRATQRSKVSIFNELRLPFCAPRLIPPHSSAQETAKRVILSATRDDSALWPIDMPQCR
jgi:hypothetical protein